MLFNSFEFLLVFLPLALGGFFVLGRHSRDAALLWLGIASLLFYAWWDARNLPILLVSIAWNYAFGAAIRVSVRPRAKALLLALAIVGNMLALIYYKYAALLVQAFNETAGTTLPVPSVELPLGVSFFTFTQIAFLVDAFAGKVGKLRPTSYVLFVSYFPHLIAGPIIHHRAVMEQLEQPRIFRISSLHFAVGLSIFSIGLMKKVLLADPIAAQVGFAFDLSSGMALTFLEAWCAALAYAMQLYFDFSGYSDMAIGLSLMIGVWLPFNFNSPYKATSIIDFWRRWHISLSTFLRDYLYIPLGGNRKGTARRYINIFITMALGGLWHGANWTFLWWGIMHGLLLMGNHAFRAVCKRIGIKLGGAVWRSFCWLLTFVSVVFAWVLFRAETQEQAFAIWHSMLQVEQLFASDISSQLARFASSWKWWHYALLVGLMLLAFLSPNTQTIMRNVRDFAHIASDEINSRFRFMVWRPNRLWAVLLACGLITSMLSLYNVTEFLYFNF